MFNLTKSLAIIAIAIAAVVGGTYAYFSDTATQENNTFAAGTLDISLANPNGSLPFTITNWAPGDESEIRLDIKNEGTLPAKLTAEVSGLWNISVIDRNINIVGMFYRDGATWVPIDFQTTPDLVVAAGQTLPIKAIVQFDEHAGNEYQGATYTGSFTVNAAQVL